ncbi:two-component sensor histidine kinase BarA [Ferrimonas balearica]|uniref:two-component sensor histidine kinase BarA n=1 Tax=Ferrimonas balearica TaxID=44012 RepID=UPI001C5618D4|nr:two-component sensor histidine kinase BarA [Ferrimonas balearica]MBW3137944.1 two-component sensor histidine kinase BarA [Ferrimonas balearica]MBY6104950.1 two-component sensor histidine kinase BarA [Ferrimonas balearica]
MKTVTKYSLRTWVLVLALAPTMLVGLLLGGYFTSSRFSELEQTLLRQGTNIIEPLAIASEYGLLMNNREYTKRLIDLTHRQNSGLVQSIAVFDNQNQIFVSSKYHRDFELIKLPENRDLNRGTQVEHFGDTLVLRTPVMSESTASALGNNRLTQLGYIALQLNKHEALLEQYRAAVAAFIIVLIGVQLNLLFTFRLLKNVTQPITEMVRAVAKIREGKLDTRLQGDLIGELDHLKRGINAMAASLSEYHNEMQQNIDQATSDLRETLEQIEIQNVELDIAKKRALEASRIKSEFLANMSHELRTPLNGVIGFTRQLLKTPLHDNQKDYLRTIERSASNLLSIINDILDFSKLEAGKMVLDNVPFALRDSLDETLTLLSGSAYDKGLEMVVEIDERVPDSLCGDVMRIQQVITNLMGNAIKFTDKGSVRLSLDLADESAERVLLRAEVSDTGIGIAEEQQPMLFQAFGQADSSVSRRFGGTGLGLVITKRLVNQMEGQIGFTSHQNQGSTFWFTLSIEKSGFSISDPLAKAPIQGARVVVLESRRLSRNALVRQFEQWHMLPSATGTLLALSDTLVANPPVDYTVIATASVPSYDALAAILPTLEAKGGQLLLLCEGEPVNWARQMADQGKARLVAMPMSQRRLYTSLCLEELAPAPMPEPAPPVTPQHPLKVLAVDDNPANLKLIATLLRELVAEVDTATGGQSAIELCRQHRYDAVFMDIQMPDIDGLMATQAIRMDSRSRHSPVIAVTAHAMGDEREKILASGMDDYLTKPIDEADLRQVLMRWVRSPKQGDSVVDWSLALTQAGGNADLAREMLAMLVDSIPATRDQLDEAQSDSELVRTIHKLHGATCYSGVPALQKLCAQLEAALKQGNSAESLQPELLELRDELDKVESAAKAILAA